MIDYYVVTILEKPTEPRPIEPPKGQGKNDL